MKRILLLYILSLVAVWANAQCLFENFYKFYPPLDWQTKTIATSDGGFVTVLGAYYDSLDPGGDHGQDMDMCVVKTDACGNTLWTAHCGYPSEGDNAYDVVESKDGDYLITGDAAFQQSSSNIRIVKLDKHGQLKWNKLYTGGITSSSSTIIKRKNKNTYVTAGDKQYATSVSKAYIFEINDTGAVLKEKELPGFYGAIMRVFELTDTSYLLVVRNTDSLFLVQTDTSFNIKWIKNPFKIAPFPAKLGDPWEFYDACMSSDMKSLAITFDATVSASAFAHPVATRVSLDGAFLTYKAFSDTLPSPFCLVPTLGGGYLIGAYMLHTDSNFNYIAYNKYRGVFSSFIVNEDKSILAAGVSDFRDSIHGELYLLKVDSLGHIIYNSVIGTEKETDHFLIYPNPANDVLHIDVNTSYSLQVEVINTTGQPVYKGSFINEIDISTQLFPQGVYFVRITDNHLSIIRNERVVIIR